MTPPAGARSGPIRRKGWILTLITLSLLVALTLYVIIVSVSECHEQEALRACLIRLGPRFSAEPQTP